LPQPTLPTGLGTAPADETWPSAVFTAASAMSKSSPRARKTRTASSSESCAGRSVGGGTTFSALCPYALPGPNASADVTITPDAEDRTKVAVGLRWKSGASQQATVTRRKNAIQLRSTDPAAIELARRIGPSMDNNTLAAALNDTGHRTGTGQPFDATAAANLRHYHHIPYPGLLTEGELTPHQVADRIGVSTGTIHYWINTGVLSARRGPANRWCIPFPPETEAACRDRAAGSAHQHRDIDPQPPRDTELSVTDVATRLGVKPDVIYNWAQSGHIPSRRGHAGRLWINFTPTLEQTCLRRITSSYKLPADLKTQATQRLERTAL
jgi:hypothetical protein